VCSGALAAYGGSLSRVTLGHLVWKHAVRIVCQAVDKAQSLPVCRPVANQWHCLLTNLDDGLPLQSLRSTEHL
jgi:hypothetical protein